MSAATPASQHRRPLPWLAAALSLVPGLGQLYTGQARKAPYYFLWSVLLLGAAFTLMVLAIGLGHSLIAGGSVAIAMLLALGAIVVFLVLLICGLFVWASAAVDAFQDAQQIRGGGAASPERRHFQL